MIHKNIILGSSLAREATFYSPVLTVFLMNRNSNIILGWHYYEELSIVLVKFL